MKTQMNRPHLTLFCTLLYILSSFTSLQGYVIPKTYDHLSDSERALVRDLKLINFPPFDWRKDGREELTPAHYDVVIVGGGMAGLAAGAALFKEGIFHIKLFDKNPAGLEGPWMTFARMNTLRSPKDLMGPALDIPHLTFRAWFDASFGPEAWKSLNKIPTPLWMDYLKWYREAMQLPVENECTLTDLIPSEGGFTLYFQQRGAPVVVYTRKVILATGRAGFGGANIPNFAKGLPKSVCAHTNELIDFAALKGRSVAILGVGASAFDAAGTALEHGAEKVDLIMRRSTIPAVNKFSSLPYKGFCHGYYKSGDKRRWDLMSEAFAASIPPPLSAIRRVEQYPQLTVLANTSIERADFSEERITLKTNRGDLSYDFFILGTGFNVDGREQPELRRVIDEIALWSDILPKEMVSRHPQMGAFPYLGPSFEFLAKTPASPLAPWLKHLYCYNYGAVLSHGLLSSEILGISIGATRLAQGIAADFFVEESGRYLECLKYFDHIDFNESDYSLNIR